MRLFAAAVVLAVLADQPPQDPGIEGPPPADIDLAWSAPQQCPSAAEVEALYRAMLSAPPVGEGTLVANARVLRHGPRRWSLRLTTAFGGASHTRELEAAACGELAEAVAMVFAVALEPSLSSEAEPPGASPPPTGRDPAPTTPVTPVRPPPPPSPSDPPPPGPSPTAARLPVPSAAKPRRGPTLMARLSVGAERGALPGAAALPSVGFGLQWRRAQLEADLGWLSPRSVSASPSSSLRAQSVHGALRGCVALHEGGFRAPFCLGAEVGRVFARSQGLPQDTQVRGPWLALGPRAGVAYRWRRLGVSVATEALRSVVTTRLRVEEVPVFSPAAFSVRAVASLEFFFRTPPP